LNYTLKRVLKEEAPKVAMDIAIFPGNRNTPANRLMEILPSQAACAVVA
jgi:hypothetical protein